ncbi:glutamine ABC transporter permease [Dolosicoccus paucivorans]|uniref:ABC transporter substrate-binding protein/permease n=1 Tax=Dolosicoccus paucivorans TaxID=84521 RepID=UPI000C801981|nr:ABC transporter substrate-binding protein/permease [Dolosicoccus paucivorans]PMB83876.1 glutamine ABC transporter permease [Dolosicoccus paucivorans]
MLKRIAKAFIGLMCLQLIIGIIFNKPLTTHAKDKYILAVGAADGPFGRIKSDGSYEGIDLELIGAIAELEGFEVEFRPLAFSAGVLAVESGQVDGIIAAMSITEERKKTFDFSDPYFESGLVFGVHKDSDINDPKELNGKNVAIKNGTSGAMVAEELQPEFGYTLTTFEDSPSMYEDVATGNSVGVFEDGSLMTYAINVGGAPVRMIGEEMEVDEYGMAVLKGNNPELIEMFNDGLKKLKESGEYDAIIERNLGGEAKEKNEAEGASFVDLFKTHRKALLSGLGTTLWMTVLSILIATVFGLLIGLMRTSDSTVLKAISTLYIDLIRGVPLIVLAFFIYFGLPQTFDFRLSSYVAGLITLILNASAYLGEIVRSGIQAVDKGQTEAAYSSGLTYWQTMRYVIMPQALRIITPSYLNQMIITLKDTSILSVIGLVELTQAGKIIISSNFQSGKMWMMVALMYFIVITILSKLSNYIDRHYHTY